MTDDELREEVARLADELAVTKTALFATLLVLAERDPDLVRSVAVNLSGIAVNPILANIARSDPEFAGNIADRCEDFAETLLARLGRE